MLSTPFLFLSLFLFYVTPQVQMFVIPPLIIHKYQHFGRIVGSYRKQIAQHTGRYGKSMRSRGTLADRNYVTYRALDPNRPVLTPDQPAVENGEYYVKLGFGTPPQQLNVVLDIAGNITWVQCQPCVKCYSQNDAIFDPTKSNSFNPSHKYEATYGDGSYTKGENATEVLSFGSTTVANIPIGCGHENVGSFTQASGIFGLGRGSLSYLSKTEYSAFAYCLADRSSPSSHLQFGSSASFSDAVVTTPMLYNSNLQSFYFVGLTGVSVNKQVIPIPRMDPHTANGGAALHFGTYVTTFPEEIYNKLRDVFVRAATGFTSVHGIGPLDTCYAETSKADFPTVAFHFGEALLTLPTRNVMVSVDNSICFGFAAAPTQYSVIGNHQQKGIRISFDEGRSMLGFSPGEC